jgi:hypothetical protein
LRLEGDRIREERDVPLGRVGRRGHHVLLERGVHLRHELLREPLLDVYRLEQAWEARREDFVQPIRVVETHERGIHRLWLEVAE